MPRDPARPAAPLDTRIAALNKRAAPMADLIPNFFGMLYGNSGMGKTVLSVRIAQKITPPDKEIVFVDSAEGWVSLLNHRKELRDRVRRVEYGGYSFLQTLEEAIRTKVEGWDNTGCVILDEFTSMAQDDLYAITMARASTPDGIKDGKDPYAPVWPDMRTSTHKTNIIETQFLKLGCHVILIGHERKDKDKQGNVQWTFSSMSETREYVKRPLHMVARCTADIVPGATSAKNLYQHTVQCHPSKLVDAKSRVGGLDITETHDALIEKIDRWLRSGATEVDEREPIVTASEATLSALSLDED